MTFRELFEIFLEQHAKLKKLTSKKINYVEFMSE